MSNDALNDEIEALTSIYDSTVLTILPSSNDAGNEIAAILALPNNISYTFSVSFPATYPDSPPQILGTHHVDAATKKGQGDIATNILSDVLGRIFTPGQVCLFDLIEEAGPLLSVRTSEDENDSDDDLENVTTVVSLPGPAPVISSDSEPGWILSAPLIVNKSTFIARCLHDITSLQQAQDSIGHLLATNKRVAGATHNISAWRIRQQVDTSRNGTSEVTIQDCDDDGETAAGGRLLHLMQLMDVWNGLVVVTRWYGGVKLGPDRFRCINAVAREALVNAGFSGEKSGSGGSGKKGKKS